ncbi:MAG: hypothetical protein JXR91_17150 [Deltaproteobacteria bacterium]|nr:hypothetical protein [Deltaproteobacteria bacterium]
MIKQNKIFKITLIIILLLTVMVSNTVYAHKYASHNYDVRIIDNVLKIDLSIDTISTLEFVREKNPSVNEFDREGAMAYKDLIFKHMNGQLSIFNNGKYCKPSENFNFTLITKNDRYVVSYMLTCDEPVKKMHVKSNIFMEQSGLNTTIATFISNKGAQRYVFTRGSTLADIDIDDLTGTPKDTRTLMKNYDPLNGFKTEKDRLAALGIKVEELTDKNSTHQNNKEAIKIKELSTFEGFKGAAIAFITAIDPLIFLIAMLLTLGEPKKQVVSGLLFTSLFFAGEFLSVLGLIEISNYLIWTLIALPSFIMTIFSFTKLFTLKNRLRIAAAAGLVNGIFMGSTFASIKEITISVKTAASTGAGAAAASIAILIAAVAITGLLKIKINLKSTLFLKITWITAAAISLTLLTIRISY